MVSIGKGAGKERKGRWMLVMLVAIRGTRSVNIGVG